MPRSFTISVFTENSPGVLQRLTILFTRRKVNIESLTVSETEAKGISRFTIVVNAENALSINGLTGALDTPLPSKVDVLYLDAINGLESMGRTIPPSLNFCNVSVVMNLPFKE